MTLVDICEPNIVNVSNHLICMAAFESRRYAASRISLADTISDYAVIIFASAYLVI
jgi:hypothetical protein